MSSMFGHGWTKLPFGILQPSSAIFRQAAMSMLPRHFLSSPISISPLPRCMCFPQLSSENEWHKDVQKHPARNWPGKGKRQRMVAIAAASGNRLIKFLSEIWFQIATAFSGKDHLRQIHGTRPCSAQTADDCTWMLRIDRPCLETWQVPNINRAPRNSQRGGLFMMSTALCITKWPTILPTSLNESPMSRQLSGMLPRYFSMNSRNSLKSISLNDLGRSGFPN